VPTLSSLPPELLLLAIGLALSLLVGVPLIRFGVWLPREVETQTLPDAALSDAQRAYYQPLDLALQASGFSPRLNFAVLNFPGPTLSRVYMADHDHAVLGAHLMRSRGAFDAGRPTSHNYLEWITKYQDGTTLYTRNAQLGNVFDRMPEQLIRECPGLADPAALKAVHDAKAQQLLQRGPLWAHGRDVLVDFRDFHRRFCDYQSARGLLVAGPGERWHPTLRTALRGVWNFFNPFADNFTPLRFVVIVLVGAGLPALAAWLTTPEAAYRPPGVPVWNVSAPLRLAVLAAAYTIAGAAVGWIFGLKTFIWATLLGYLPLRVLTPHPGIDLLLALWMAIVAERVAAIRSRREMLV
jgi:hypothetical protein